MLGQLTAPTHFIFKLLVIKLHHIITFLRGHKLKAYLIFLALSIDEKLLHTLIGKIFCKETAAA
jgi:hypothetical protein